jgi:hypothetical protein
MSEQAIRFDDAAGYQQFMGKWSGNADARAPAGASRWPHCPERQGQCSQGTGGVTQVRAA